MVNNFQVMDELVYLIYGIVRLFHPHKRTLHSFVYMALHGKTGLNWLPGYHGPYSPVVAEKIRWMIEKGSSGNALVAG